MFPQLSSQLDKNIDKDIYINHPFRGKTFEEMLILVKKHAAYQADGQIGLDHERQEAARANFEIRNILNGGNLTSKKMLRFKDYISARYVHETGDPSWLNDDDIFSNIGKLTKVQ